VSAGEGGGSSVKRDNFRGRRGGGGGILNTEGSPSASKFASEGGRDHQKEQGEEILGRSRSKGYVTIRSLQVNTIPVKTRRGKKQKDISKKKTRVNRGGGERFQGAMDRISHEGIQCTAGAFFGKRTAGGNRG